MVRDQDWIQWPDRDCWAVYATYGSLLTALWVVVYGGASYITSLHNYRVRLHLDAEMQIPFIPSAAIVYLSLFPMLWISPFVLQRKDRLKKFAVALAVLIVLSGIVFIILPAKDVRNQVPTSSLFNQIYEFADWINLSHNYLPSLHVGMAVLCAYFYSNTAPAIIAFMLWGWASTIAISTLLIHEHYIADVATGGMLGYLIANSICRSGLCPNT